MTRVAVVGGGITGLVAARALATAGLDVTLLEAGTRWGGKLGSIELDGLRLDSGAESVLARRPEAVALINDLGLGDELVHPTAAKPELLVAGRTHPLPRSVLGVPADLPALRTLLSGEAYGFASGEPDRPAGPLPGDVAIGSYVDERFGPEVTDRLLEPMLGGIYAGQSRTLSFEAVAHHLFEAARHGGSLASHAAGTARPEQGPVFAGLAGGIGGLVPALVADLERRGVELRLGATLRAVGRTAGGGFRLSCGAEPHPQSLDVDGLLLTVPAPVAGRLLGGALPGAAEAAAIPYASVAVLTWAVRGLDPVASGLLVPPGELPTVKALTYSSTKWGWLAERAARTWGAEVAVVRASIGRFGEPAATLQLDDEALTERTFAEAAGLPGWGDAELLAGAVTRWGGALPQYLVGHRDRVRRIRAAVATVPGLALAGAAWDGVGIAACVASAQDAAAAVVEGLGGTNA